ncbi:MAG: hypothetical protein AAB413_01835 [Patescibacteria group bacterium]
MLQEEHITQTLTSQPGLSFVHDFLFAFPKANLFLVGGAVRDLLLNRRIREFDFDFVVQGLDQTNLEAWLGERGELNLVGQHFGVYKFMPKGFSTRDMAFIDIALPRTEAVADGSLGGYKDFDVQSDPNLSIEDDLARRDFTINAMAFDVRTRTLIDPFNGQADLQRKLIRAVGNPTQRFTEDLSRILRGIRFASELEFVLDEATSLAMKELLPRINTQKEVNGKLEYIVPRETVGVELAKTLSRNPTRGLQQLQAHGAIAELFPDIQALLNTDLKYLTPLAQATPGELTIVLTLLLRALNKTAVHQALSFTGLDTLERGSAGRTEADQIVALIDLLQKNFRPTEVQAMRASEFERCFFNGKGLLFVRCLDLLGQKELAQAIRIRRKQMEDRWLVDHDESIAPLVSGQDVLALGVLAGPQIRLLLDQVRDRQLDGLLMRREDALDWLEQELKQKSSS